MHRKRKGNLIMIIGILSVFFSVVGVALHIFPDNQLVIPVFFLLGLALLFVGSRIKRRESPVE